MHQWLETGRRGIHVERRCKVTGEIMNRTAVYVRCKECGQNGFRLWPKRVVFTWSKKYSYGELPSVKVLEAE